MKIALRHALRENNMIQWSKMKAYDVKPGKWSRFLAFILIITDTFPGRRLCLLLLLHFFDQAFLPNRPLLIRTCPSSSAVTSLKDATPTSASRRDTTSTIPRAILVTAVSHTPSPPTHISPSSLCSDGEERFKACFTLRPPARLWEPRCFGHRSLC